MGAPLAGPVFSFMLIAPLLEVVLLQYDVAVPYYLLF